MSWKNVQSNANSFEEVFIRLSSKVETANTRSEQLAWANHQKWYLKLIRDTKSSLKKLKKTLKNETDLLKILRNLESSLKNILNVNSDTRIKWNDLTYCKQTFEHFKKELDRKIKLEYDLFPKRDFEIEQKLCFILMPFDRKFNQVYSQGIKPAVRKAKMNAKRADEIFASTPVVQDIWEYINKASLVIADVTDRNPNVFYEVGLSHALPKLLIILTQNKEDVPFDLQHIRWIRYTNTKSGRKKMTSQLYRTIKTELA